MTFVVLTYLDLLLQKYRDLESQDRSRYSTEYKGVFGHVPPAQQAAAAAA